MITLLLHHKENKDQGEFMNVSFEGAIYFILKFTHTYQRGNNSEFLKMFTVLLTPKYILSYIFHQCLISVFSTNLQGFIQAVLLSIFWTKVEFLNVVKCRWGSQGAVSSATDSDCRVLMGICRVNLIKDFALFTAEGQINRLR